MTTLIRFYRAHTKLHTYFPPPHWKITSYESVFLIRRALTGVCVHGLPRQLTYIITLISVTEKKACARVYSMESMGFDTIYIYNFRYMSIYIYIKNDGPMIFFLAPLPARRCKLSHVPTTSHVFFSRDLFHRIKDLALPGFPWLNDLYLNINLFSC